MAGQRLHSRSLLLLVVAVVSICLVVGVLGFTRLQKGLEDMAREKAEQSIALVEEVLESTGRRLEPGAIFQTGGGSVRALSLSELRSEFGFAGALESPFEFSTVSRGESGRRLVVGQSIGDTSLVLLAEVSLATGDRLLGDVMGGFLVAAILVALSATAFAVAADRSFDAVLTQLETAARHFVAGDLGHRVQLSGSAPLSSLAGTLNKMAALFQSTLAQITRRRNELEGILASMVEGVIVLDTRKRISAMNASAGRLFGVDAEEAAGQPLIAFLRNAEVDSFADDTLSGEEPTERTITVFDIRPVHIQLHGTVLRGDDGKALGALIVTSDVTRIRRLETVRREFVANVSHELRTPITSILGFVETLREGALEEPDRARRFLEIIHAHANRLNLIIEDLLSLSRLESYDATVPVQECQIHEIVNSTKLSVAPAAARKNISIEDSYSGPTEVTANATLLEQAIKNLMDNAVKYSPENTAVRLSIRNRDGFLTVEVSDSGVGIPAADLPRIFERFYRVDRARSRDHGGTGLGLAIVKHIAIAHRGTVTVESTPGKGSTFVFSIPQDAEGS